VTILSIVIILHELSTENKLLTKHLLTSDVFKMSAIRECPATVGNENTVSVVTRKKSENEMFPYKNQDKKDWLLAAAKNNITALHSMMKSTPSLLPVTDPYSGYSVIHWAAKHDNDELIRSLLKDETNYQTVINKQSNGGYTPLHIAAINKSHNAFSVLMLTYKADRNIRDHSGKTATSYLKNVITSSLELKRNLEKNYG